MKKIVLSLIIFSLCFLALSSRNLFSETNEAIETRNEALRLQSEGNLEGAIPILKKAISLDPKYATPHNDLGILYERTGQLDLAIESYRTALRINPDYAGVHTNLASLYESQGNFEEALKYWQRRSEMGISDDPWKKQARDKVIQIRKLLKRSPQMEKKVPPKKAKVRKPKKVNPAKLRKSTERRSKRNEKVNKKKIKKTIKKLVSGARRDMADYRHGEAIQKLKEARALAGENQEIINLTNAIKSQQNKYELATISAEVALYKESKLVEVEKAWYPPKPEPDAGKVDKESISSLSTKSEARLELEKKSKLVIASIDFNDARLKDVIEYLATSNGINIVLDEQVIDDASGVTIHLKNIPLLEALDIILRTKGLKYRFEENIIWITTAEKLAREELVVKVYDVQDLVSKLHDFPSIPFNIEKILEVQQEESE